MARNKKIDTIIERITKDSVENVMHNSMIPYAEHVIRDRALPRVEDGLKPVQRRILFTMHELGLTPDKPHRKCARIVGDCLGKYHPHGESSVYDALTRMAQDFIMSQKLVDGHGNFGSIDGDSPAAMRYTEAKMTPIALEMLKDLDKNTVPFVLNFEDELKEPDILPSKYPNLLVNGANGIAVGLATNIPPHNLNESIDATIAMLKNPDISLDSLLKIIIGPDFPTGGIVVKSDELYAAYKTGRGKIKVLAKLHIEESVSGRKLIVISEIPYQISKSTMLEKIQKLTITKPELFSFIFAIRDESDRTGIRAVIEIKKDIDPQIAINLLYKYSDLQVTFGINIVAIAEGKPKQLSLKELIFYYIKHQKTVTINKTKYEIEKNKSKAHIMQGLIIALNDIDEVINLIKSSKTPSDAKKRLIKQYQLTDIQAQAILEIRLQRLTNLEIKTLKSDYEKLVKLIAKLDLILNDESVLISTIIKELNEIKKNNSVNRKTIISDSQIEEFPDEDYYPSEDVIISYSFNKNIKRENINKVTIEDISITNSSILSVKSNTKLKILVITNTGNFYNIPVIDLPDTKSSKDIGLKLTSLVSGYDEKDEILSIYSFNPEYDGNDEILFITKKGKVKKTLFKEYLSNRSKFKGFSLTKEDELVACIKLNKKNEIVSISSTGEIIRFNCKDIELTPRKISSKDNLFIDKYDKIIYSSQVSNKDFLVLISDKGYAKKILASGFTNQNPKEKGVIGFNFNKNNSNGFRIVTALVSGNENQNIIVIQSKSEPSLINLKDIPIQLKSGKGSPCVMSIMNDDVIKALSIGSDAIE